MHRARRGPAGLPATAEHDRAVRRAGDRRRQSELGVSVRYLTPHNKWSIHCEYQDNLFMLSLSRGGQAIWISDHDAAKVGIKDNDWIEAVNRNGVVTPEPSSATGCPRARSTCTTPRTGSSTCP